MREWFNAAEEVPGDNEVVYLFVEGDGPIAKEAPFITDAWYDHRTNTWCWRNTTAPITIWTPCGWAYKGEQRVDE
jgi:hypothetical protein